VFWCSKARTLKRAVRPSVTTTLNSPVHMGAATGSRSTGPPPPPKWVPADRSRSRQKCGAPPTGRLHRQSCGARRLETMGPVVEAVPITIVITHHDHDHDDDHDAAETPEGHAEAVVRPVSPTDAVVVRGVQPC